MAIATPPDLAAHLNLTGPPVEPRPSATVVVVRGRSPWEFLLVRRPGGADFAPAAYVFPGGTVHAGDSRWDDAIRGAAARELFEEAGLLLARRGNRLATAAEARRVMALTDAGASFPEALSANGLRPAFDRLAHFARWVTPRLLSRRYDARFFLARAPAGQPVRPQPGEVTDWQWVTAERALRDSTLTLVYATRAVIESIAGFRDSASLLAWARGLGEVPIVEPRLVQTEAGWEITRD